MQTDKDKHSSDSGPSPIRPARSANELTALLKHWSEGDRAALDALLPLVYDELRKLAAHHMRGERSAHTLQPTALVHEAYLRLAQQSKLQFESRSQFFALVSSIMRHILVDQARAKRSAKRGGGAPMVELDNTEGLAGEVDGIKSPWASPDETIDLLALDQSLQRLEQLDPRQARVVEMRFFLGMSVEDVAAAMELSPTSIKREWSTARAWLLRDLGHGPKPPPKGRRTLGLTSGVMNNLLGNIPQSED